MAVTWPFRLLVMYCRSRSEMNRCSYGVLLVRRIHSIIVIVDVIPTRNTCKSCYSSVQRTQLPLSTSLCRRFRSPSITYRLPAHKIPWTKAPPPLPGRSRYGVPRENPHIEKSLLSLNYADMYRNYRMTNVGKWLDWKINMDGVYTPGRIYTVCVADLRSTPDRVVNTNSCLFPSAKRRVI